MLPRTNGFIGICERQRSIWITPVGFSCTVQRSEKNTGIGKLYQEYSPQVFFQSISRWLWLQMCPWKLSFTAADCSLQWCHNGHDSVSNHQPHDCLLNRLFKRRSKKTSKLRFTGLCAGNSPGTGEFPAQMASYAENVSISWRHHDFWRNYRDSHDCWHVCVTNNVSINNHLHHWPLRSCSAMPLRKQRWIFQCDSSNELQGTQCAHILNQHVFHD